ncbi:MAG: DUF1343 domain-containing protein [Gemmatimonadetes bacterium]|nr:DUF1343 domain-containing protein [Gemmatimonadota bacterium]
MSAACDPKENGQAAAAPEVGTPDAPATVLGVTVLLEDSLHLVAGHRAALITNHTGRNASGTPTIDLLHEHPEVELVALLSPEHGIRGVAEAGEKVASGVDGETGLPIHSLYGETLNPTDEMLDGVEVLLFDIQDIGARYYTYLSTMAVSMEAAGDRGIPFIVLDRPNPLGSTAQGNILDPDFSSFVGMYPVPMRHGLTAGEFARLVAGVFGVEVDLSVVPMRHWNGEMDLEDTGLPWVPPSPNIPTPESALHYPGTCLFEGTNLSVGRGTDRAFQHVGAPWLDGDRLAADLNALELPHTRFEGVRFTPSNPGDGKFDGVEVGGVRVIATGAGYDPSLAAVAMLQLAREASGDEWQWRTAHFDRLAGTDQLRLGLEGGLSYVDLAQTWSSGLDEFTRLAAPFRLY